MQGGNHANYCTLHGRRNFAFCFFQPSPNHEKELRRIEAETARLEQQNDTSLVKFIADDWVCVNPARSSISKSEFIQNMKHNLDTNENGINPYTIEKKNVLVRVFGDFRIRGMVLKICT
jgi:hypothetical protein